MKKIVSLLAILIVLSGLLFGCKAKTEDTASGANQSTNGAGPGAGRQFARADLSGEVQAVNGNSVTIKVIKMPTFNGNRNNNNNQNQNGNNRQNGGNNNGNNRGGNGGSNSNWNRGQGGAGRALEFTGETKTITIPAGVSITTMIRGQNGIETNEIDVKDIKQGNVLQIWYSDKEKQTISRVSVNAMQQRQNQNQGQTQTQ